MTPLSNFKVPGANKNWDNMTQLTPTSNISLADPSPTPVKTKVVVPQPTPNDELIPTKHSSSKRVKLIKQEKK
jgi:hypothetical protein